MKKLNKPVLAKGEITGHAHILQGNVDVFENENIREFSLSDNTTLVHEEHKPIDIPIGDWRSGIVKEYDHFLEESKNVAD